MIKSFKKLISDTPDLNDVQQNVFDTIKEIQSIEMIQQYNFDAALAIADNSWVQLGDIVSVSEGNYSIDFGALGRVNFSSAPTYTNMSVRIVNLNDLNIALNSVNSSPLVLNSTGNNRGNYFDSISFNTSGARLVLQGQVEASGGTVTDRNIYRPFLKIQRRSI